MFSVPREQQDSRGLPDPQAPRGRQARLAPPGPLDLRVTQEALGLQGRPGTLGPRGPRVMRVRMARLAQLVTLGRKARRVPRVLLETRDRLGQREIRALRVRLE